jgi:cell division protein ZapA
MGQVAINVNGRLYRFDCGDGEEPRLRELAAYVKGRIESLVKEYGKVGDERLMLTAALLITDELMDARAMLAAATKPDAAPAFAENFENAADAPNMQADAELPEAGIEHRSEFLAELDVEPERAEPLRKVAGGEG